MNWKKKCNMKVTIIPIVIGAFGTVTKRLVQGLKNLDITGRMETVQTTALLKSTRILRRVLESWGDLLSLKLLGKTISWRWYETLPRSKMIRLIITNGSSNLGQMTSDSQQIRRTCRIVDFDVPADHKIKLKENEKKDKYLDLAWKLKKTMEQESDGDTYYNWCSW